MTEFSLTFIQTGTSIILAILSYLIKRLISRIDHIEREIQSLKIAFTELNIGAVKRNGFDKRIELLSKKIEDVKGKLNTSEKNNFKEVAMVKRAIVKIQSLHNANQK